MRLQTIVLFLSLLLSLDTPALLAAEEQPGEHAKHDTHTITLDGNDVRPAQTSMDHGETLAFANFSSHPVRVTFTEPAQLKDKVRCGLVHSDQKHVPSPAWALFSWQNDKLMATVPPGQFASVCSLEPGSYTFTATPISTAAPGSVPNQELPAKGQIVVK
jgi:hypothetical protein